MKRVLLLCTALIAAIVLLGGTVCLIGNPVSGDTWGHMFPKGYLYLGSHQQPPSFRLRHTRRATGIEFGRLGYVWDHN